jgi:hypothetical protein
VGSGSTAAPLAAGADDGAVAGSDGSASPPLDPHADSANAAAMMMILVRVTPVPPMLA